MASKQCWTIIVPSFTVVINDLYKSYSSAWLYLRISAYTGIVYFIWLLHIIIIIIIALYAILKIIFPF